MAARRRRASAARRTLTFVLVLVAAGALILYLTTGGRAVAGESAAQVEINEVMTSNKGAVSDETGDFPDWVEIHNRTDQAVDISGYGLSDDLLSAAKWTFPNGTVIEPGGFLVVFCSGEVSRGRMHAGFKLSSSDDVILSTVSGKVVDSISLRAVSSGSSLGRSEADSNTWAEMFPSPGYPNSEEGVAAYLAVIAAPADASIGVTINEFMASNASTIVGPDGSYCDWIELYNATGQEVDLSGYGISDSAASPLKYKLPEGTKIPAYGVLLIYCSGRETPAGASEIEAPFGLASYRESVVFSTPAGRILDAYDYTRADTDVSYARSPDGTGDFTRTAQPTPGYTNNNAGLQAFLATLSYGTGELIISEVLNANSATLKQADGEYYDWIEIYNRSNAAIPLAGYALSDNAKNPAKWLFPDITIEAGEYLTILASGKNVSDAQKKNNLETNFRLSAAGDVVLLFAPDTTLLDKLLVPKGRANVSYGRTNAQQLFYTKPTPSAANGTGLPGYAEEPKILLASGLYDGTQSVSIEVPAGCSVTYTLDGSEPGETSRQYTGPVTIASTAVLRARAFMGGLYGSDVASASYIVYTGENTVQGHRPTLPVVSLAANPEDIWGGSGIYVVGDDFAEATGANASDITMEGGMNNPKWNLANFTAQPLSHPDPHKRNWERNVHVDFIDGEGTFEYGADAVIRIFGAYSRAQQIKGLALVARSGYGDASFDYPVFDNREFTQYRSLILRPSGQDAFYSRIRDFVIISLFEDADLGLSPEQDIYVQAHKQVAVYINGKYWGVYDLMEKITKHFIAANYGIADPDSIDILVGNGNEKCVISGTNCFVDYTNMVDWADTHDLSASANYDYIRSLMDVENFAAYTAAEIVVGNTDTGNIKYWRSPETDNKWRWLFYDFCWAMNRDDDKSDEYSSGYRRDFFTKYLHPEGHGAGKSTSTKLVRALLKNADFRELFLQKVALMLNEVYTPEKILSRVDELQSNIDAEMQYDADLWDGFSYSSWKQHCDNVRAYARNYQDYCLKYVQNYFSLSNSEMQRIFGRVSAMS